ncbi:hypothetical protein Ndes2526B_g05494 [Nannochloris sp. 'desiccata']|nr:hypothetical protein KSW81_007357 [Chlorella desiccata (nom. nud.)]KAH7618584.1 putative Thylakoid lumenal 15.0 kDa protein 2, chloroplastic [Chlorella desiccata (nom. nud.)]
MNFTLPRQPQVGVLQLHHESHIQRLIIQTKLPHVRRSVASQAARASADTLKSRIKIIGSFIAQSSCAAALALALTLHPSPATALETSSPPKVSNDVPFLDLAKVMPAGKLDGLQMNLRQLEADTGYKLRVLSRFGPSDVPSIEQIRSGWGVDDKTVVVFVDPSAPNIMTFRFGMGVQKILPRPFFTELQSRLGNQFFVRENGEQAAVYQMLDAMDTCFRREGGCRVPPGLPSEQYYFTLGCAVAGGLILGSVLRIEPQGFVKRRWVYGLLFSPLWASLSINFGLGPVISRTDDLLPVIYNIAATVAAALLIYFYPQAAKATGLSMDQNNDDDDTYGGNSNWK